MADLFNQLLIVGGALILVSLYLLVLSFVAGQD
jgi:hypothetical protein